MENEADSFSIDLRGDFITFFYSRGSLFHSTGMPSTIRLKDGKINCILHSIDGKFHKDHEPCTYRNYIDLDGTIRLSWYNNDTHHRFNGPACIDFHIDTFNIKSETWYFNGKEYTVEANDYMLDIGKEWYEMNDDEISLMWMSIL